MGEERVRAALEVFEEGGTDGVPGTFAESLDLPAVVAVRLGDDGDADEVVEAILEAAGHQVERREGLLVAGDVAVCVLRPGPANVIDHEQLNAAYIRLSGTRTARGLVVCPGVVNARDIELRERLAPTIRHLAPEDLQRMADAVALGQDPLTLVVEPDPVAAA